MNHKNENLTKITNKKGFFELNKTVYKSIWASSSKKVSTQFTDITRMCELAKTFKNLQVISN